MPPVRGTGGTGDIQGMVTTVIIVCGGIGIAEISVTGTGSAPHTSSGATPQAKDKKGSPFVSILVQPVSSPPDIGSLNRTIHKMPMWFVRRMGRMDYILKPVQKIGGDKAPGFSSV
jgi:hypothetical protein